MGSRGGHSHFGYGNRSIGNQWTDDVKKKIKDYGKDIGIYVSLGSLMASGIRPDLTMSALQDVEAFYHMFPKAQGIVNKLVATDLPNAYAAMCVNGTLELGLYGKLDLQTLNSYYKHDLQAKFHPANTDYHAIIWHELGHALEVHLHEKKYGYPDFGPIAAEVLENATMKVMELVSVNSITPKKVFNYAKTISGYAVHKKTDAPGYGAYDWAVWETLAEAIGDYAQNKKKAHKFSVAIAEEVMRMLDN